MKKPKVEVIFDPEKFKGLTAKDVVRFIQNHERTAIVGWKFGKDRHIVRYETLNDLRYYKEHNPYSEK